MQVSPSRTITIGDNKYVLDGSFKTLRAVQEHFDKDIVQILIRIMDMSQKDITDLIAIGSQTDPELIGQAILDEIGAMTNQYNLLKLHLTAWLNVAIAPKAEREKKSEQMQAILDRQNSPGATTSDSPSEPSDGSPVNSGEQTSGS